MSRWKQTAGTVLVLGGLVLFAQEARAENPAASPANTDHREVAGLGATLSDDALRGQDGRQDTRIDQLNLQMTDLQTNGTVSGNTLSVVNSTLTTGANSIGQGAFANAAGVVTVIQNSGNQVLIQNDMILNLSVK